MALPSDFWRNEQMLNIFRTKPCQRLYRDGLCEWRSQCQYSHCLDWPRRPPQKHHYSVELCQHIRLVQAGNHGEVQVESCCPSGARCQNAHSKEEVLYHPHFFKTMLCEEFRGVNGNQRSMRSSKNRCHRYYCPFAHSQQELRTSPLSQGQLDHALKCVLETFPSDDCCGICSPHRLKPLEGPHGGTVMGFVPSGGQPNPQEAASPQHTPPGGFWNVPQAAVRDGYVDNSMGQKSPYAPHLNQQGIPHTPMVAFRPWGASGDLSGFTAVAQGALGGEGCGIVVPGPQLQHDVVNGMGGQAGNAPPPAGSPPPQQMLVAVGQASPMGCGMATPVHPNSSPLPMVTPISASQVNGADSSPASPNETVPGLLRSAGLERFLDSFAHQGLLEKDSEFLSNMSAEQLHVIGMSAVEQASFRRVLEEIHQKAANGRDNMVMMQSSAPRTPNVPQQHLVMLDGYGQYGHSHWVPTASPPLSNEGGLQPYAYPSMNMQWSNGQQGVPHMMAQFISSVPNEIRPHSQSVQQQDVQVFLPPVPPFPVPPAQHMQAHMANQSVPLQLAAQMQAQQQQPHNQQHGMQCNIEPHQNSAAAPNALPPQQQVHALYMQQSGQQPGQQLSRPQQPHQQGLPQHLQEQQQHHQSPPHHTKNAATIDQVESASPIR